MSTKTIPARTVITCDSCGAECTPQNRRQGGGVILKADALDMQGHAVADATQEYDLCDRCRFSVEQVVFKEFARARGAT